MFQLTDSDTGKTVATGFDTEAAAEAARQSLTSFTRVERTPLTPDNAQVGDGARINYWSDVNSVTIIEVLRNGKQIKVQRDNAVRSNQEDDVFYPGGFAGHVDTPKGQKWDITPDPDGAVYTANWSAKRNRFFVGGPKGSSVTAGRFEKYDYNF